MFEVATALAAAVAAAVVVAVAVTAARSPCCGAGFTDRLHSGFVSLIGWKLMSFRIGESVLISFSPRARASNKSFI